MKRSNTFRLAITAVAMVVMVAVLMLAPAMLPWLFGSGAVMATTGTIINDAVDTENTTDAASELLMSEVSQKITEMKPARTPLDTITRSASVKKKINAFKTDYYAVDVRPFSDTTAAAYVKPVPGVELAEITVTNIDVWSQDDTALAVGITGSDGLDLVLYVADIDVANSKIKVQALNGTVEGALIVVPSIANTTTLVRMGVAKAEKDAQTTPYAMIPEKEYNYCQIFMAQVEESTYMQIHKKEVNWSFSDYEALNIYDMKTTIELSYLFGFRKHFTDKLGRDEKYACGGITGNITEVLEYGTGGADRTVTNDTLIDWCADAFTGNSGSETRIMFAGAALTSYISKIDHTKNLTGNQTEIKWGIEWKVISTNFGRILWKLHPLFAQIGWTEKGVLIDVNNLEKHEFVPMSTRELNLKESGQRNVKARVIEETSCPVLRYPDTHRLIRAKA